MRLIYFLFPIFFYFASCFAAVEECGIAAQQNIVVLPAGEVYNGNYFAAGTTVEISGIVNGDVYVFAEQVVVDGEINGDLLGSGGSIDISGKVSHNCRIVGGQILMSGMIGGNVTAAAGNLQLLSSASLGGSLVATAGNADLASSIGSDVYIAASNLRISSEIHGDLKGYVGQMRITSKGVIDGNVEYRSSTEAWIEPGAVIKGEVTHRPSFVHGLVKGTWIQRVLVGSKVIAILMNFIYTFVIGAVLIKFFPRNLEAALNSLKIHPLKSLSCGLMILVLVPLASLVLLMTILGVPFALTLIAANIISFYTAKVYSIIFVSNALFGKMGLKTNRLPSFFLGTIFYFILTLIPIIGTIIAFAAMLFGLGAGILAQGKRGIFSTPSGAK